MRNSAHMKRVRLLVFIFIAGVRAESEGPTTTSTVALSARLDKLEDMLEKRLNERLEHMVKRQLKEKLDSMLEERLEGYQRKAEEYANEAVQVARQELIKSEKFVVKVADENAEHCTARVNGLETKLAQEVDAAEGAANEHRRNIDQQIAGIPDKDVIVDVAERLRRLEASNVTVGVKDASNVTAELKKIYKAMNEADNKLASQVSKTEETVKKTEETVKIHIQDNTTEKNIVGSQNELKTQIKEIAEEVRTQAPERGLKVFKSIAAHDGITLGAGCATVDLSASKSVDLNSATGCGTGGTATICPGCFIITTAHASNSLTLQKCSTARISSAVELGTTTGWTAAMRSYTIVNSHETVAAIVCDGYGTPNCYKIAPKTAIEALCYTSGNHVLYWPNTYFSTLNVAGAAQFDSTLVVAGAAQFDGTVVLGNAAADEVTIKGNVVTSGTPSLTFGGAAQFDGTVGLGAGTGNTVTIKGNVVTDGNPSLTFGGAAEFTGTVGLGDHNGDTVTIKGNVVTSLDPSVTLGGAITVGGAALFSGTVGLGDAAADTVTIKGNVATSGTPTIDFTGAGTQTNVGS